MKNFDSQSDDEETENNFCCLDIDFKYTRERERKKKIMF